MAGTDCSFSSFAGYGMINPDIVWAKFRTLGEGAAIASERLWRRTALAAGGLIGDGLSEVGRQACRWGH